MLSFFQSAGNGEVVETAVDFAFVESTGDGHGAVDLDTGRPEGVVEMYVGEGDLYDGGVGRLVGRLGIATRKEGDKDGAADQWAKDSRCVSHSENDILVNCEQI